MRRYDDPVEVRVGEGGDSAATLLDERAPAQFLWHGRLWKVRAVLAHWVETGAWWSSPGVRAVIGSEGESEDAVPRPVGDLLTERELWRVEAGPGPGPTASPTAAGSSTSPSTGPTAAGSSSGAWTDDHPADEPADEPRSTCRPRPTPTSPARRSR